MEPVNLTTIIVQAITTLGAVAIVIVPLWFKLHSEVRETRKDMNGKLAELIAAKAKAAAAEAVIGEKVAQEVRQDAKSADDRKP